MTLFHVQSISKFDDVDDLVPCSDRDNNQIDDLVQITRVNVIVNDEANGRQGELLHLSKVI